jgi:hypothetical protein
MSRLPLALHHPPPLPLPPVACQRNLPLLLLVLLLAGTTTTSPRRLLLPPPLHQPQLQRQQQPNRGRRRPTGKVRVRSVFLFPFPSPALGLSTPNSYFECVFVRILLYLPTYLAVSFPPSYLRRRIKLGFLFFTPSRDNNACILLVFFIYCSFFSHRPR